MTTLFPFVQLLCIAYNSSTSQYIKICLANHHRVRLTILSLLFLVPLQHNIVFLDNFFVKHLFFGWRVGRWVSAPFGKHSNHAMGHTII